MSLSALILLGTLGIELLLLGVLVWGIHFAELLPEQQRLVDLRAELELAKARKEARLGSGRAVQEKGR